MERRACLSQGENGEDETGPEKERGQQCPLTCYLSREWFAEITNAMQLAAGQNILERFLGELSMSGECQTDHPGRNC